MGKIIEITKAERYICCVKKLTLRRIGEFFCTKNFILKRKRKYIMKNGNRIILPLLFVLTMLMTLNLIHFKASAATNYEIEANNSYATANTPAAGDTVCGTINQHGDNDYYEITASSNGKIDINFEYTYSDHNYDKC